MSYSTKASDVVFSNSWEIYPYSTTMGESGDLHLFKRPGDGDFYRGDIPRSYVKLDIRKKLKELYPEEFPNMDTIGYAVRKILSDLEIKDYFSAEDRGWEISDYWATLEAVFIPKDDYQIKILFKVNGIGHNILNLNMEATINTLTNELAETQPIKN